MSFDPFNPFERGGLFALKTKWGSLPKGPRRDSAPPEPPDPPPAEPAADASESPAAQEQPKDKVILRNPVWEAEDVGFNEETDISVEADLPESQASKTRVDFELFAKTPEGPESISKAQGHIDKGKAKTRIPVYIPQYKDEDGNHLAKVEYYFTAKHGASDLLKDESKIKLVDRMAERHIESHILQDVAFATGKSFVSPRHAPALKSMVSRIKAWKATHPDAKLAVFGHADAVGQEDGNKRLSERRAKAVFALLVKDAGIWKGLYDEEKWGLSSTQELLMHLGHDPGALDGQDGPKTQEAVKTFQEKKGLSQTGQADAGTREALYEAFMGTCNGEAIVAKDFDAIDGKPHAGCSEFNQAEKTEGACEANRRVAVHLLKSNRNFPIQYPCKHGDVAPCKAQRGRKGERRTAGFGCLFYDKLVVEQKGGEGGNSPAILDVYFETEAGGKTQVIKAKQKVFLIIKSSGLIGELVDIDLSSEPMDFLHEGAPLEGGVLEKLGIDGDVVKIELVAIKRKKA